MEQNLNLAQLVAAELRKKGNKSVKSLYWNIDQGNLSVFTVGHTPEKPRSFNYTPEAHLSVEEIVDYIAERCDSMKSGKENGEENRGDSQ